MHGSVVFATATHAASDECARECSNKEAHLAQALRNAQVENAGKRRRRIELGFKRAYFLTSHLFVNMSDSEANEFGDLFPVR